jgi:hypothetical protein
MHMKSLKSAQPPMRQICVLCTVLLLILITTSVTALAGNTMPGMEIDYEAPRGYVTTQDQGYPLFAPQRNDDIYKTCAYGISPPRASTGSLEQDAQKALTEIVVPGLTPAQNSQPSAMRGTAAAGWPYFWYRAEFEGQFQGNPVRLRAMAMALPARSGRVHIVFGIGTNMFCMLDDPSFTQLFHSLRPHNWKPVGGSGLARELVGTWSYAGDGTVHTYTFNANGHYDSLSETTSGTKFKVQHEGRYELRGDQLILIRDDGRPSPASRVSVYEEWTGNRWIRGMSRLDEAPMSGMGDRVGFLRLQYSGLP